MCWGSPSFNYRRTRAVMNIHTIPILKISAELFWSALAIIKEFRGAEILCNGWFDPFDGTPCRNSCFAIPYYRKNKNTIMADCA